MARQVSVEVYCDICSEPVVDVDHNSDISFGVAGVGYKIDLCSKHKDELFGALDPFLAVAASVSASAPTKTGKVAKRTEDLVAIRAWANASGVKVNPRGRISQAVVDAYNKSVAASPKSDADWEASAARNPDIVASDAPAADGAKTVSLHDGSTAVVPLEPDGMAGTAEAMSAPSKGKATKTTAGGTRNPDGSPVSQ